MDLNTLFVKIFARETFGKFISRKPFENDHSRISLYHDILKNYHSSQVKICLYYVGAEKTIKKSFCLLK